MTAEGAATRIGTDVDFDRDGVQVSVLRVPYSRNSSAWGTLLVPIVIIKNGDGPTVLLTAGAHGDEYEGPITLANLSRELAAEDVRGRVVMLPGMNMPGLQACQRLCPIDHRDLNRTFPGRRDGTYTHMVAHYVAEVLLPMADAVVDFHSGGYSLEFLPSVIMHHLGDSEQHARTLRALEAFAAPLGMVLTELDDEGTLDTLVERSGTTFLSTELAGRGGVTIEALRVAERGVWNLLGHFGVLRPDHPRARDDGARTERLVEVPHLGAYVSAPEDGVFEPFVDLGDTVTRGQKVGRLHFLTSLSRAPRALTADHPGLIVAKRAPGKAETGDCLAVIASDYAR